jgi:hypothetical protein
MAVSLLIGHLLFRLLIISKYLFVTPGPFLDKENIVRGTKIMLLQYLDIIKAGGFNRFIIVYFLLSIALTFYLSIRIVIKNLLNKEKEEQNESIYILFSCIFLFTVFLTPALSGRYYAGDCIRYNILVFIVALANWGIILRRVLYKLKLEKQVLYSACCLLLLCSITFLIIAAININPPTQTLNYKPDVVKAILYVDSKNNLKNGVGTYWNAKLASVLLGKSKRLYQVIQNIRPDYLINNPNVYYHINRKNSSPPVFNYIVDNSNDIDTSVISKLFSGQQKIIYNFNNIVIFKVPDFIFTGVNEPYVKLLD